MTAAISATVLAWAVHCGVKHIRVKTSGGLLMNHIRFLKYLDEVARTGSIRQAAERLHIAPSAVNRRIQDLEEELGTPLFERLPRGVRLNAAGELFVGYIRSRSAHLDQVRSEIEDLKGLRRGMVKLIASQAMAPSFLPKAIANFRQSHPLVAIQAHIGDHLQAVRALREFETDLALVVNLEPEPDIERMAEFEQKLVAIMHRDHPLSQMPELRIRDCVNYPLVLPEQDIASRQLLDQFLVGSSIKFRPLVESNSFEFMRGYLYHEQAVTFQIAIGAVTEHDALVVKEISDKRFPKGQLVLASLRNRQLPVVAYVFAEHLRTALAAEPSVAFN
jgi:DNA-binding transcriptional LysR family regulator